MVSRVRIYTPGKCADLAFKTFRTFEDGKPDLIHTGFQPIDDVIGGVFAGTCGALGLATGIGKSSAILTSAFGSPDPVGVISLEDTEDLVGSRLISLQTGVDSLRIRRKTLTSKELALLDKVRNADLGEKIVFAFAIGGQLEDVEEAVEQLSKRGCKLIWLDYLQKVRGDSGDRRNDVGRTYTKFQSACWSHGCASMVASQFSRQDPTAEPKRSWLKESGDIENEARLIILGWRDQVDSSIIHMKLDKCNFGGEGIRFDYRRNGAGILELVEDEEEEF